MTKNYLRYTMSQHPLFAHLQTANVVLDSINWLLAILILFLLLKATENTLEVVDTNTNDSHDDAVDIMFH